MGAQGDPSTRPFPFPRSLHFSSTMVAMKVMKAMKKKAVAGKSLSKTGVADSLATKSGLKKAQCAQILDSLAVLATAEVKKSGKFVIPGLCMIKTRVKAARKAGKRMAFGKEIKVKAAPAKKIVKAFCVSALKKSI